MNDLIETNDAPQTYRPSAAIDPARLDYLWNLAGRMARSTTVPKSLKFEKVDNKEVELPIEVVTANVFAVVEQADRWNQSPFALLSAAAIVHGRLGFEGKVIAAVLEANFGIVLNAYYTGEPGTDSYRIFLSDKELPEDIVNQLKPDMRIPGYKIMDGSVKEWKTSGNGSPWRPDTYSKMLIYRGTREWCRIYKPAAIMGVLADDELMAIDMERRAQAARDVSPAAGGLASRFGGGGSEGFRAGNVSQQLEQRDDSMEMINRETGEVTKVERNESQQQERQQSASAKTETRSAGKEEKDVERQPKERFIGYSKALLRFNSNDTLIQAHNAFWNDFGGLPKHPVDDKLGRFIFAEHQARVKNDKSPEEALKDITSAIDESFAL